MLLMMIMMMMGLAALSYVDGQTRASLRERVGESQFNMAEGALTSQTFLLARSWPGSAAAAYPSICQPGVQDPRCPDANALLASYNAADYRSATTTWRTQVRDNPTDLYTTAVLSQPSWDANGDNRVWVRAQSTVRGRSRAIVGLVEVDMQSEQLPRASIVAGWFATSNNGNKAIVCTKYPDNPTGNACTSSSTLQGPVQLRCASLLLPTCLNIRGPVQIQPYDLHAGYAGGAALNPDALQRLRARAIADGTYYASGCPANPSGKVVFVESGNCSYNNSAGACCNSLAQPGVFIVRNGTVAFGGNIMFWGVVYAVNAQNSPLALVSTGGTSAIVGGVLVDGLGGVTAGSSKLNIVFNDGAYAAVRSYGTARMVQNRWREIPANA